VFSVGFLWLHYVTDILWNCDISNISNACIRWKVFKNYLLVHVCSFTTCILLFQTFKDIFIKHFLWGDGTFRDNNYSLIYMHNSTRLNSIATLHFAIAHSGNSKPTAISLLRFVWHFWKIFGKFTEQFGIFDLSGSGNPDWNNSDR